MQDNYLRKALITNIVDGDTVDALIDLGYNTKVTHRLRLLGIDTPERNEDGWKEATMYTKERILGKEVIIQSYKGDAFGRYLAYIYLDGANINQEILDKGYAKPYIK